MGDRNAGSPAAWKWLTFPVYLALSVGLFAGYNAGRFAFEFHNARVQQVGDLLFAVMFSFGLAQLVTRPLTQMMLRRRAERARKAPP